MAKRKQKVQVTLETEQPKTWWESIKAKFYHSESVALAWLQGILGTITAVVAGVFASTDFSSILGMFQSGLSFTKQQLMVMGIGAVGMGAFQYWVRVRGTKEVSGRLLPKAN